VGVLLALIAAGCWGASDFGGGLLGRRLGHNSSVALSFATQGLGLVVLTPIALAFGGTLSSGDLWLGAAAGGGGSLALIALYRGLAIGRMGMVAPITGAVAAAIPALLSPVIDVSPSPLAWVGVVLALAAIVLVARERAMPEDAPTIPIRAPGPPGLLEAVLAGTGFAMVYILLDRTTEASNLLSLVPMKVAATVLLGGLLLARRESVAMLRPGVGLVAMVGLLDNSANVAYLLATREGLLAAVAVLTSLYPVGTVLLARAILKERLAPHQQAGLVVAIGAIVLIGVG
jgi:drug/metabolite transporter (DMT)-like permease